MRRALLLCLLLVGCGPKEGDVYEEMLTGQRVEIGRAGTAREVAEWYQDMDSTLRAAGMPDQMRLLTAPQVGTPPGGMDERVIAVVFETEIEGIPYKTARLVAADKFKQRYRALR